MIVSEEVRSPWRSCLDDGLLLRNPVSQNGVTGTNALAVG